MVMTEDRSCFLDPDQYAALVGGAQSTRECLGVCMYFLSAAVADPPTLRRYLESYGL